MASSNRPFYATRYQARLNHRYFIIAATNFPNLLQRTEEFQGFPETHLPFTNNANYISVPPYMHPMEEYERMLYNTLRFELQQLIQGYLQRTRLPFPINLVFDFSGVQVPRL